MDAIVSPCIRGERLSWWRRHGVKPVLALAVLVLGQAEVWTYAPGGPRWSTAPTLAVLAVALAWRRRAPVLTAGFVTVITVLDSYLAQPPNSATLVVVWIVAFFAVGAAHDRRRVLAGAGLVLVASALMAPTGRNSNLADLIAAMSISTLLPYLAGLAWRRQAQVRALGAEAERLAAERDETAQRAAEEERSRLARELHDVISHTVGTIVVQAGAGDVLLDRDPQAARASLQAIETSAREAMGELRRLLGLLRSDQEGGSRSPQPGLARLDELVERVRSAGLPVALRVEGQPRPLPAAVDLSAYRILQEALTNALKHGEDACAEVLVRYLPGALEIDVRDDGNAKARTDGNGYGLAGARERAVLLGGSFIAGPLSPRGWQVHANLPIGGAA